LAIVIITIYLKTFIHQQNNAESINLNVERIYNRNPDQTIYASTRYKDWNDIIEKTKKNYFLGYGIQADRLLINQSASNAFVYSFASGGVCGLLIFIIIYVRTFLISSILLSKYKTIKINRDFVLLSAVITNLFLLIRSFVENSFAVYGIDFLIFLICSIICEKKYKK
jgi:phosphatidylserine synthase